MPRIGEPTSASRILLQSSKRRTLALVFVFGLWSLLVVGRLSQVMVFDRDAYLLEIDQAWVHGIIPALRGRILDIDGRPLAWSTRQFVLRWHIPQNRHDILRGYDLLNQSFSLAQRGWTQQHLVGNHGRTITLRKDLTPAEFKIAGILQDRIEGLNVDSLFVRHRHPSADVRARLGITRLADGMEVGVSGKELVHDGLLRGRPGLYRVMLDRSGEWLLETFEKVRDIEPGYDVYLPIRVPNAPPPEDDTP